MKQVHESHQLHHFVNNSDIEVSPQFVEALLEKFSDLKLAPVYGKELNALSGDHREILMLTSADRTLRIEFPSNEVIINKEGGSQDDFQELSSYILAGLGALFPFKRGNRVSIINFKFFCGDETQYKNLYSKLFTYASAKPFEWENRIAEKRDLKESNEPINSISAIRRLDVAIPFVDNGESKDLIMFEIDSNTVYQNAKNRFGFLDSIAVYNEIFSNNKSITTELKRYF